MTDQKQIPTFDFTELNNYFSKKSTMEILGVDRDENAHSKFLGWLLENEQTKGIAISYLIALLKDEGKKIDANTISKVSVKLEDFVEVIKDNKTYHGRADIVVDVLYNTNKHLHIIIENKVFSLEHKMGSGEKAEDSDSDAPWQTCGYYDYYKKIYSDNCFYVYLTLPQVLIPEKISDKKPQCDKFIHIDYQDLMTNVLQNLRGEQRIDDYITCLEINKTQNSLMAVSEDLKNLVDEYATADNLNYISESIKKDDFWQNNKDVIRPLFKVLTFLAKSGKYPKQKEKIIKINKVVNGKDYTAYVIKKENELIKKDETKTRFGKNALVKKVVELYIEDNQGNLDIEKLCEAFPQSLRMINKGPLASPESQCNQVIDAEQNVQSQKNWKENWKPICGKEEWLVNQTGWDGKKMMDNFIEHVKKIMPIYTIEEVVPGEDVKEDNK